jgi:hypothetical protein
MRLKALLIAVMVVFGATSTALAVGYERYVINEQSQRVTDNRAGRHASLEKALRQASLCETYPKVLDEVAFTVKDILGQFGIIKTKSP